MFTIVLYWLQHVLQMLATVPSASGGIFYLAMVLISLNNPAQGEEKCKFTPSASSAGPNIECKYYRKVAYIGFVAPAMEVACWIRSDDSRLFAVPIFQPPFTENIALYMHDMK